MTFEIVSGPTYPLATRLAILLTLAFVVVAVPLARRSRQPLLVLTLPLWWNFSAVFLALANVAGALDFSGHGRFAAAAGVAEAQIPLKWGCLAIAVASAFFAWRGGDGSHDPPGEGWRVLTIVGGLGLVTAAADYWLSRHLLFPRASHAEWKLSAALTLAALACGVLLLFVVAIARAGRVEARPNARIAAIALTVISLVSAAAVRQIIVNLQKFASGG